jgi:hypothetical protein
VTQYDMSILRAWTSHELKNKQRQLIERIGDFEADQNQRCDHQIKAEMHERLETKYFRGLRQETPAEVTACRDARAPGHSIERNWNRGPPPPRK